MELTDGEWGLDWAGYCVCQDNIKSNIFNESFTPSIIVFTSIWADNPPPFICSLRDLPFKGNEDLLGFGPH